MTIPVCARVMPPVVLIAAAILFFAPAARAQTASGHLYAAMARDFCAFECEAETQVEVVDLASMTQVKTISLGSFAARSIAVSPDERRLFAAVMDPMTNEGGVAV